MTARATPFDTCPVATPAPCAGATDRRRGIAHLATLGVVWTTFAISGIVFAEPAPVDLMLMGLVVLLPVVGLAAITTEIAAFAALWLAVAAAGFLASPLATDTGRAATHISVSLYLSIAAVVLAAFIARNPVAHTRLVLSGTVSAALAATAAGLAGYFAVFPGADDLFTLFGRASGTFKDPNVFGAFIVLPLIYCLQRAIELPLRRAVWPLLGVAILALGVLLSFSRGAWLNLAIAVASFGYLSYALSLSARERMRIVLLASTAVLLMSMAAAGALQFEKVADLLAERATLTQSYDTGPEGRFGGQEKALGLVAESPFGIGAQEFGQSHHHEEVHNVYLSMALNAGWIGGGLFLILNTLTLAFGATAMLAAGPLRPMIVVTLSAFLGTALEGLIIDTDHWRHLYVEMALVWGLAVAARMQPSASREWSRIEGPPV